MWRVDNISFGGEKSPRYVVCKFTIERFFETISCSNFIIKLICSSICLDVSFVSLLICIYLLLENRWKIKKDKQGRFCHVLFNNSPVNFPSSCTIAIDMNSTTYSNDFLFGLVFYKLINFSAITSSLSPVLLYVWNVYPLIFPLVSFLYRIILDIALNY